MLTLTHRPDAEQQRQALAVDRAVRAVAPALAPAHLATWHEQPRLVQDRTRPWIVLPLEVDPLRTKQGGYPLPSDVAKQLSAIASTGIEFDRIAVAHELVPSPRTEKLLASADVHGTAVSVKEAADLIGPLPATADLRSKVQAVDTAVQRAFDLITKAGAAIASAPLTLVDPIVFGVAGLGKTLDDGEPALFYPLVAWEW